LFLQEEESRNQVEHSNPMISLHFQCDGKRFPTDHVPGQQGTRHFMSGLPGSHAHPCAAAYQHQRQLELFSSVAVLARRGTGNARDHGRRAVCMRQGHTTRSGGSVHPFRIRGSKGLTLWTAEVNAPREFRSPQLSPEPFLGPAPAGWHWIVRSLLGRR
jgi:hypothetical protein